MDVPYLEIFLGTLGFGISIMFCTSLCRACSRLREEQIEREVWRRSELEASRAPPIYFIPFRGGGGGGGGGVPQQDADDIRVPRYSEEFPAALQEGAFYTGPPPAYNELGIKPDDLPPAYTEHNVPVYPVTPHLHTDVVQPRVVSQP